MESGLLEFIVSRGVEIELGPSGEQDRLSIPKYEVNLRKDEKEASFVILGNSESKQLMTLEDAFRALSIRVQLHENNADLSSYFDMLCRDTATRLKEFLGSDNYSDFLSMETGTGYVNLEIA